MTFELNKIHNVDARVLLGAMESRSVDLTVSSPPYFNLREYASWQTFNDYIASMQEWFNEIYRVTKDGRHVCWNIQGEIPEPTNEHRHYHTLLADTVKCATRAGFESEHCIVWNKKNQTQLMFGSYPYPPTIMYSNKHEYVCLFRKPGKADLSRKTEASLIDKRLWNKWKDTIWEFQPETGSEHPAAFPEELPKRCILLHSFVGDTVLDPFCGSGTTALVAEKLKRNWITCDTSNEYCQMAFGRIEAWRAQGVLDFDQTTIKKANCA